VVKKMGIETFIDTNSMIWIHQRRQDVFSMEAQNLLANTIVFFSPITRLELNYLWSLNKLSWKPERIIDELKARIPLFEDPTSFSLVIDEAEKLNWTRDPFDRIIVAQAALHESVLITKDRLIREHYKKAII
jgi:PIN domain nuclease of toxin-antitoxin system